MLVGIGFAGALAGKQQHIFQIFDDTTRERLLSRTIATLAGRRLESCVRLGRHRLKLNGQKVPATQHIP